MDCSNHVPVKRTELAEKPLDALTPQQLARAFVADSKLTIEKGFWEFANKPGVMDKVWKKLFEMAENGNMRAINALLKLTVRPASEEGARSNENAPPVAFNFSVVAPQELPKPVVNESPGGGAS